MACRAVGFLALRRPLSDLNLPLGSPAGFRPAIPVLLMLHPHTELRHISETMGYGVVATRLIPKGTLTWVKDDLDQTFSVEQVRQMSRPYQQVLEKYAFVDAKGMIVLCWDHARFFNHSCEANCLSAGYDFELAVRDIQPGEELTDDYGTLNLREEFPCACRARKCRKMILPDDMERLAPEWDDIVREVFAFIPTVDQPLWPFLKEAAEVEAALKQPRKVRSIRTNYAPRP
jgi:uncharacterized protein